jgi:hypothetical protein
MSEQTQPSPSTPAGESPPRRRRVPTWVWFVAFAVFWVILTQWLLPQRGGLF